jgi:RNA polymerase sigma-70 factor (ECF subfamily)
MTMETLQDMWTELSDRVRGFVGRRVNDPHAADDIAQDVMLKVRTQLDTLPPEEKLPAWVFAVARNAVIDHYRAAAIRNHAHLDNVGPLADTGSENTDVLRELAPCLLRMVERLPEPYRQAMTLADFEGLTHQQLADRTGISLTAAKSRVQRARQQMREMIQDCCRLQRDGRGNVMDYETTERSRQYCGDADGKPQCGE